jgi:hypothetical protein
LYPNLGCFAKSGVSYFSGSKETAEQLSFGRVVL